MTSVIEAEDQLHYASLKEVQDYYINTEIRRTRNAYTDKEAMALNLPGIFDIQCFCSLFHSK